MTKARASDPRFQRSLDALIDATITLVDQSPVEEISITRIVEQAGVTRPTFYQHFADVSTAVQTAGISRLAGAFPLPDPLDEGTVLTEALFRERITGQVCPVLKHLAGHRVFYVRVVEGAASAAFFQEIVVFIAARMLPHALDQVARQGETDRDDLKAVLAGGMMWLVIGWLRDDTRVAPDVMAARIAGIAASIVRQR